MGALKMADLTLPDLTVMDDILDVTQTDRSRNVNRDWSSLRHQ